MTPNLPLAKAWFRKAENDIATVETLIKSDGPYDTASFHTQQAAEKYLKGFLAFHGITNIPKTHNLVALHTLCNGCTHSITIDIDVLSELTNYAVNCRYDLEFFPDEEIVTDALQSAKQVRTAVLTAISSSTEEEFGEKEL